MRFAHPELLLLVLPVLGAAARAAYLEARRRATLVFTGDVYSQEPTLGSRLARWLPLALKTGAALLVVLGLARPQKVSSRFRGTGEGIDIMLAVDTSLSMRALDFDPLSRIDAAKDTAKRFILGRVEDRIGILQFGGAPILSCPLTHDYDALQGRLEELEPGQTNVDGTAIGDGIVSGLNHLKGSTAKSRIIILLTDGRSNTGLIDPMTAAKTAAAFGVKVYTIGCAKRGQSVMPVDDPRAGRVMVQIDDDLNEDDLSEIARLTGGKYYRATTLKDLRDVFADIDKLEKSKVKLPDIVSHDDLYRGPVSAAGLLLLAEAALSSTILLRWP